MTTLYLELGMGAAGDMLAGALVDLMDEREWFVDRMNSLEIPGVHVEAVDSEKCGIVGTHIDVSVHGEREESIDVAPGHDHAHRDSNHHGHHHHASMPAITSIVESLEISDRVKADALACYRLIAEAESATHKVAIEQIHFHEVGTADAIADIVGVCLLMERLNPDKVVATPIHVGSGQVRCAHGLLPVPAPATARILMGIPTYSGDVVGELCTPTGAALLRHFVDEFGGDEVRRTTAIGYGMGTKDFPAANCVRASLGEDSIADEHVVEIVCNLDDMTPEALSYACDRIRAAGAVECFTSAVTMKKSRLGVMLTCLAHSDRRDRVVEAIFAHTTTIGVREHRCERHVLRRQMTTVETPYGPIRVKLSSGGQARRAKPEYDDCAEAARHHEVTLDEVWRAVDVALADR